MPAITIGDHGVFYREYGNGSAPLLVLIHGLFSDSSGSPALAGALAERFYVVAPDMLGHGRSARPERLTLEDQGRIVTRLIETLGCTRATLVGNSMGSYIAAQAAILEPALISALALVVPKAHGTTSSTALYAARRGIDLSTLTPEESEEVLADALWSPSTPSERRAQIADSRSDWVILDEGERAIVERSIAGFDLRSELPSITAPTLVVSGRSDGLNPPEMGEEVSRLIPGSRFVVYENSGHMLAAEEMERLVTDIFDLVQQVPLNT